MTQEKNGATWIEPGVSKLTTAFNVFKKFAFQIGELDGTITDRIYNVKSVLDLVGNTVVSDNLIGTKWSKLMVNVALSGMSAALGCTFGDIINNEFAVISAIRLVGETINVAHARDIKFAEMSGVDIEQLDIKGGLGTQDQVNALRNIFKPQSLQRASMLQDLEKGRKTEIDYINGLILQYAESSGILTPYNSLVVKLIKQAEETKTVPNFETNIQYFKDLTEIL